MEKFMKPGVGGIIEQVIEGVRHVLIQERYKEDAPTEQGLIEIPAGKIREFENIYDCLRREIKEETGLDVVEIQGETDSLLFESDGYKVLSYEPFFSSQNIEGTYPIMVQTFICKVKGELLTSSNETRYLRWLSVEELKSLLEKHCDKFYPMHVNALRKYLKLKEKIDFEVRLVDKSDLHEDALKSFNRYQVTNRVKYKENDQFLFKYDHFVDYWDENKKKQVIKSLIGCIESGGIVAGAFNNDKLIGFANVEGRFFGRNKEYLELSYIHLSNEYRGCGIGKQLFALCCEKAKEKGARKLYIAAHPAEETQRFYTKMGCVPAAEVNREIYDKEPRDLQLEVTL